MSRFLFAATLAVSFLAHPIAYGVLTAKGVPARLVVYPDENHWIQKPQNSRHWHGEVFGWLEKYLGAGGGRRRIELTLVALSYQLSVLSGPFTVRGSQFTVVFVHSW